MTNLFIDVKHCVVIFDKFLQNISQSLKRTKLNINVCLMFNIYEWMMVIV